MKKLILFLIAILIIPINVDATSGRLRKDSIISCNGVSYGQHGSDNHWHIAEKIDDAYYANGNPISTNPCNTSSPEPTPPVETPDPVPNPPVENNNNNNSATDNNQPVITETKSDDNTIKELKVDGKILSISEDMNYTTTNEEVEIIVIPTNSKASFDINDKELVVGNNIVEIMITAENGDTKTYNLNILRNEKISQLSDNTDFELIIDGETIKFVDNKADLQIGSDITDLEYEYKLDDNNSKLIVENDKNLQIGETIIIFKVIAENGDEEIYELNVDKWSSTEETVNTIIGLGIMGGTGYGIYYLIKKNKKKSIN